MTRNSYIFIDTLGNYIGMDYNSGGYPVKSTRWSDAKEWSSIEEAYNYYEMFRTDLWTLKKVTGLKMTSSLRD